MIPTIDYIRQYFDIYNAKYFNSVLPYPQFELMKTKYLLGQYCPKECGGDKIRITIAYEGAEIFFQNTLIHEMIHYYLNFIGDEDTGWARSHGPHFKREAARINKDGWNIQRCATEEEMSLVTLIVPEGKKTITSKLWDVFSIMDNPLDEYQLIDFILKPGRKDKEVILWLSYPEIQKMVYSELNEDNCSVALQERRCKAIIKAYKVLIDFNLGNQHNLFILHNDAQHFYKAIGNIREANRHKIVSDKYTGAIQTSKYIIKGREIEPIKEWSFSPVVCTTTCPALLSPAAFPH